jgi:hypothetical protein
MPESLSHRLAIITYGRLQKIGSIMADPRMLLTAVASDSTSPPTQPSWTCLGVLASTAELYILRLG